METKNDNPIDNVTWKGALNYLDRFVNTNLMRLIEQNNMSEKDATTLLGISPNSIHLARKTYILENGLPLSNSYSRDRTDWITNRDGDTHFWATTI